MSLSPNVPEAQEAFRYEEAGTPRWILVLFILLILAVGALGYFGYTTQIKIQQDLSKSLDQNRVLSAQLEQANERLAELKGHVEVTEEKLGLTRAELAQAKSRAESIRKEQQADDQKLAAQLQQSQEQIGAVATEVGSTKKDVAETKNDLEVTKTKLDRAVGDMGVMSGLIARSRDDLDDLRRRGDRNYFEFTISRRDKAAQKVGTIQLKLDRVDTKKQRYTMTVFADDKAIEKRDRTAGEPVQFYVQGAQRMFPYEIVVFTVGRETVSGYLATPKEGGATPAAQTKPTS